MPHARFSASRASAGRTGSEQARSRAAASFLHPAAARARSSRSKQCIKHDLFAEDKLYKDGKTGRYHVPEGLVTRREACSKFGVSIMTWWRWERAGWIKCGTRIPG